MAELVSVMGSLTEVNLLKNDIGMEAANQLAAVLPQHKTLKTLCGFKPNQTEASFYNQGLKPADALLIAADLRVHGSLTQVLAFSLESAIAIFCIILHSSIFALRVCHAA